MKYKKYLTIFFIKIDVDGVHFCLFFFIYTIEIRKKIVIL